MADRRTSRWRAGFPSAVPACHVRVPCLGDPLAASIVRSALEQVTRTAHRRHIPTRVGSPAGHGGACRTAGDAGRRRDGDVVARADLRARAIHAALALAAALAGAHEGLRAARGDARGRGRHAGVDEGVARRAVAQRGADGVAGAVDATVQWVVAAGASADLGRRAALALARIEARLPRTAARRAATDLRRRAARAARRVDAVLTRRTAVLVAELRVGAARAVVHAAPTHARLVLAVAAERAPALGAVRRTAEEAVGAEAVGVGRTAEVAGPAGHGAAGGPGVGAVVLVVLRDPGAALARDRRADAVEDAELGARRVEGGGQALDRKST